LKIRKRNREKKENVRKTRGNKRNYKVVIENEGEAEVCQGVGKVCPDVARTLENAAEALKSRSTGLMTPAQKML